MSIWTAQFWKATTERAIATAAQSAITAVALGAEPIGVLDIDAVAVLSLAGGGAVLSILKSIAATAATGSPSIGGGETLDEPRGTHRR